MIIIMIIIMMMMMIIIIIIPTYSRVHQMSWTGVFLGPCSSSSLRGPRNLRGIFAGCELFPVVLLFGVDLVRSSQALDFQMFYKISGYCSQCSNQHRLYCCLLFPKPFYCDFQVLVFSDLFHFFLIDSAFQTQILKYPITMLN